MTLKFSFSELLKELDIKPSVFPKSLDSYNDIRMESAMHYIFDSYQPNINPVSYEHNFPIIFEKYEASADTMLEIYVKKKLLTTDYFKKYGKYCSKLWFAQRLQVLDDNYLSLFLESQILGVNKKLFFLLIARDFIDEVEQIYKKYEIELQTYLEEFIEHALYHKNISLLLFFYQELEKYEEKDAIKEYNPWALHNFNEFESFKSTTNTKSEYMWKLCYEYLLNNGKKMKTRDLLKWLKYIKNKDDEKAVFDLFFEYKKVSVTEFIKILSKYVHTYSNLYMLINKYFSAEEIIKSLVKNDFYTSR